MKLDWCFAINLYINMWGRSPQRESENMWQIKMCVHVCVYEQVMKLTWYDIRPWHINTSMHIRLSAPDCAFSVSVEYCRCDLTHTHQHTETKFMSVYGHGSARARVCMCLISNKMATTECIKNIHFTPKLNVHWRASRCATWMNDFTLKAYDIKSKNWAWMARNAAVESFNIFSGNSMAMIRWSQARLLG